jgi:hypothetical protein
MIFKDLLTVPQQHLLIDKISQINIPLNELIIPQKTEHVIENHKVIGKSWKMSHGHHIDFYWKVAFYHNKWHVSYSPASPIVKKTQITFENWNKIFTTPYGIDAWIKELHDSIEKRQLIEYFFYQYDQSIPDDTIPNNTKFNSDESFTEDEINNILPKTLEAFKQKILESKIPDELKIKINEETDKYYEKAKKGTPKRDIVGGFFLFVMEELGKWGLKQFFDFVAREAIRGFLYAQAAQHLLV